MIKHWNNFKSKLPDELAKAVATIIANIVTGICLIGFLWLITFIFGGNDFLSRIEKYTTIQTDAIKKVMNHLQAHETIDSLNNIYRNNNHQINPIAHDKIKK